MPDRGPTGRHANLGSRECQCLGAGPAIVARRVAELPVGHRWSKRVKAGSDSYTLQGPEQKGRLRVVGQSDRKSVV